MLLLHCENVLKLPVQVAGIGTAFRECLPDGTCDPIWHVSSHTSQAGCKLLCPLLYFTLLCVCEFCVCVCLSVFVKKNSSSYGYQ